MTIFPNRSKLSDPTSGKVISDAEFAYVVERARLSAFRTVHAELDRAQISQKELAARMDMDAGQLSRLLGAPGNWTLVTIAKLLWAISGARLVFSVEHPMKKAPRNDVRPHWTHSEVVNVPHVSLGHRSVGNTSPSTASVRLLEDA